MESELQNVFAQISERYSRLPDKQKKDFVAKLHALSQWHEEPMDYVCPETVDFPEIMYVAYAVCHPQCGTAEFIVDGSTQTCGYCGSQMFRTEVAEYTLKT